MRTHANGSLKMKRLALAGFIALTALTVVGSSLPSQAVALSGYFGQLEREGS